MKTAIQAWDAFWFDGGSPVRLAVARVLTAAVSLWVLFSRDLPGISGLPPIFWSGVGNATRWRYLLFPGHMPLERALQAVAALALFGVLLGLWPRFCALVSALIIYHLAPLESIIWTSTPYGRGLDAVIPLIALFASPCADALSFRKPPDRTLRQTWEYAWPIRVIELMVICVYFFSGYSKLRDVGWEWTSADNMRTWMLVFNQGSNARPFTAPGLWFAAHPALCHVIGIATILFELSFPVVLFSRRARWVYIPGALIFHTAIFLTMNITVVFPILFLVFLQHNWLRDLLNRPSAAEVRIGAPAS